MFRTCGGSELHGWAGGFQAGEYLDSGQTTGALTIAAPLSASAISLRTTDGPAGVINVNGPLFSTGNIAFASSGPIDVRSDVSAAGVIHATSQGNFNVLQGNVTGSRIELEFPSTAFDFFVNGVRGAVTGGGGGFFSGGVPAVIGTTLEVTYGTDGGRPSDPLLVQATNELIQATTRVFDPMELLGTDGEGGASQFKVQGGGTAIIDANEASREGELPPTECR